MRMSQADRLSQDEVRMVMLGMPFRKFEQRKYLHYDKQDLSFLRFRSALWRQLTLEDRTTIRSQCERAITEYYPGDSEDPTGGVRSVIPGKARYLPK
jgi:hypothetical protein